MSNKFTMIQKIILLTNTLLINENIYKDDYVHMTNAVIHLVYFNMTLNKEQKEEEEEKNEETKRKQNKI